LDVLLRAELIGEVDDAGLVRSINEIALEALEPEPTTTLSPAGVSDRRGQSDEPDHRERA